MRLARNERGAVLVFITLMMVLLFVMVGMGLDTGHLSYIRSQGQPAVDAAALAAVNALPTGNINNVWARAGQVNFSSGGNPGGNNYLNSPNNLIGANNVTLVKYDGATGAITTAASIGEANGVRVALENSNPYDGAATPTPMKSPLFLTPLLNLFGQKTSGTQNVSVSAVAVLSAIPGFPVAIGGCQSNGNGGCIPDCRPSGAGHLAQPPTGCLPLDPSGPNPGSEANPYTNCKLLQVDSSAQGGNGKYQDSGWTTFSVPSANAPAIKALVRNNQNCGNIPPINIGTCIYLNNGQITPVLNEFDDVYRNNGNGFSGAAATPYYNDYGVIPVVDYNIGNYNQCWPVLSWAKFGLRDVIISGSDKYLLGDLVCGWSLDKVGGTGCYTTRLVRDTKSGM